MMEDRVCSIGRLSLVFPFVNVGRFGKSPPDLPNRATNFHSFAGAAQRRGVSLKKMSRRKTPFFYYWSAFVFCWLLVISFSDILAQDEPALSIRLSRDWGAADGGRIKLAAAEAAERQSLQEHVADSPISPEEKLRRRLEDSRFNSEP
jgi:hypothetical protein